MSDEDARANRRLALIILASFIWCATAVILRIGIGETPYDTVDSSGRPMGFNDPLGWKHYLIMVRHFRFAAFLKPERIYEWVLFAMHAAGALLLFMSKTPLRARVARWFFAVQPLIFPLGVPSILFLPVFVFGIFSGTDREGFVDLPFILCATQPVWLLASYAIMPRLRGPGLGLARIWDGLARRASAGAQMFVAAVR
jgi:hypothetical protein